jgi:clusterin-associated protein 1
MLRALNYNRIVSLENFNGPNFELIADILYWLAQKYDPQSDISDDIN